MACTMSSATVKGREIWWQTSCRTERDWYAITYDGKIIADHLPTKESAEQAGREAVAALSR